MKNNDKNIIAKRRSSLIVGVLFVLVFVMGWTLGHQDAKFGSIGYTPKLINKDSGQDVDFSTFWRTWDLLEKKYDGNIDYQKMVYGAIRGMVDALGDPYTAFLSPEEAKQLEDDLSGEVSGIGAEVGIKNNRITVIAPLTNSPAKKAGLQSGDVITKIGEESTANMDLNTAVSKIRGEAGSKVKLVILRNNTEKTFEITRAKVSIKSVASEIKERGIGYISINRFDTGTTEDLKSEIDILISKGVKSVILDLRDNPGGYLDESVTVASQFINEGVIVSEKNDKANGRKQEYKATGNGKLIDSKVKIVVLINGGSASASEIVAGALQDYKRATLVGEKTFGKGSVQEIESLSRGAKLRVTTAHWYTPLGRNIVKEGIVPDIEVVLTEDDYNKNRDPQMAKALELLKK